MPLFHQLGVEHLADERHQPPQPVPALVCCLMAASVVWPSATAWRCRPGDVEAGADLGASGRASTPGSVWHRRRQAGSGVRVARQRQGV